MIHEVVRYTEQIAQLTPDIAIYLSYVSAAMAFSPRIKREVREAQEGRCHACGCVPCDCLQIHHRIPQALGGTDGINNAVGLCGEKDNGCHQEADRLAFEGIIYPQVHRRGGR